MIRDKWVRRSGNVKEKEKKKRMQVGIWSGCAVDEHSKVSGFIKVGCFSGLKVQLIR